MSDPGQADDTDADRESLRRAMAVVPVLIRIETAGTALGLPGEILLHAGPPYGNISLIPAPVLNSACLAAMLAGIRDTPEAARAAILAGDIRLEPAQAWGVVTPLAMVVNRSTPLQLVTDAAGSGARAHAPINDGNFHPSRVGLSGDEVFQQLRWMSVAVADRLDVALREPIELLPLAVEGLEQGDDCHGLTAAASTALVANLHRRLPLEIGDAVTDFLHHSSGLFLNLWMAASKCMMQAGAGVPGSSFVTAAGGNGVETGIQIAGLAGQWFTIAADPPAGAVSGAGMQERCLGAIGDSAVVELMGLGAMALKVSAEQRRILGPHLPPDYAARVERLTAARHPAFAGLGLRLGMTARRVAGLGAGPVIGLGILDRLGQTGRLGAGIYDMPPAPFRAALAASPLQ